MAFKDFFQKIIGNTKGKDVLQWESGTIAFSNGYSNFNVTERTLLLIPEVYSAIDMIANAFAAVQIHETKNEWIDNNTIVVKQRVKNSNWDLLLNKYPNDQMSQQELFRSAIFDLFVRDGFYWYLRKDAKGKTIEIIPIDPANIRQVLDKDGTAGYEITTWGPTMSAQDIVPYDDVIAVNFSDITRINDGSFRNIFKSLLEQLGLKNVYDTAQLNRRPTILAHVKVPNDISEDQSKKIKANFDNFYKAANTDNSSVLVTDPKVEVNLLDGNKTSIKAPVDAEFYKSLIIKLANALHIPLPKLNIVDTGQSFYKSRDGINIDYISESVQPLVERLISKLNHVIFKKSKNREFIANYKKLKQHDLSSLGEFLAKMTQNGIMTLNEKRDMLDLAPIEGGNKIYANGTISELGTTPTITTPPSDDDDDDDDAEEGGDDAK